MMFLLRSAFWLSLVFSAMPEAQLAPTATASLLARQAAAGIQSLCTQDPRSCLSALSKVAALDAAAVPATLAPQAAPLPKPVARQINHQINHHKNLNKSNTLTASDLAPAWHAPVVRM